MKGELMTFKGIGDQDDAGRSIFAVFPLPHNINTGTRMMVDRILVSAHKSVPTLGGDKDLRKVNVELGPLFGRAVSEKLGKVGVTPLVSIVEIDVDTLRGFFKN